MNRILIIGISGTGKTKVARKLSDFLKIPVIHYDELVWDKNWTEVAEKIVEEKIEQLIQKDKWIFEGYIQPAGKARLEKADQVIYLDYSGFEAMLGGLQRWWAYRGKTRPELATGCIEKLDLKYLKLMWTRGERPEIEESIEGFEGKVIRLKSREETYNWLSEMINKSRSC